MVRRRSTRTQAEKLDRSTREGDGHTCRRFPYLAEVVAGHVAKVGSDFTAAFEYGPDLILDALEERRETA
jgi:hypothetical protein